MKDKLRIVELFAGVGGFRLGFEGNPADGASKYFETVFASQWEPSTKNQFAFDCYNKRFGGKGITELSNTDIALVESNKIPEHDVLVGGFPCQDYSVAQSGAKGIQGKKGVLWWEIKRIVEYHMPKYVLLENVDRLLKSPTLQRGRDFGIIIKSFDELGYDLEWRVINAAEYGEPQRRRRVFIFAVRRDLETYSVDNFKESAKELIFNNGFFASKFPVEPLHEDSKFNKENSRHSFSEHNEDILKVSDDFEFRFENSGISINGEIATYKTVPLTLSSKEMRKGYLKNIVEHCEKEEFYLNPGQIAKNKELKGGKRIERIRPNGEPYTYSEGAMNTYEPLNRAARTMLTSEGTINRSSHFIEDPVNGRPRKITPDEADQINTFPKGWTDTGMTVRQRYFCMGNALVVNLITKMSEKILEIENSN